MERKDELFFFLFFSFFFGGGGGTIGCPLDKILVLKEPALLRFLFSVPANWCKNGHILLSIF